VEVTYHFLSRICALKYHQQMYYHARKIFCPYKILLIDLFCHIIGMYRDNGINDVRFDEYLYLIYPRFASEWPDQKFKNQKGVGTHTPAHFNFIRVYFCSI